MNNHAFADAEACACIVEIRCKEEGYVSFRYRISPSPDFLAELAKWGDEVKMEE